MKSEDMFQLVIVSLCWSLATCQSSLTILPQLAQGGLSVGHRVTQLAQGGLTIGNSAAQLGGRLTSQGSAAIASSAKQIAAALAALKAAALQGGVDVFKQAIGVGGRVTASIPVVGPAVGLGTNALKKGADLVNTLGQSAITAKQTLTNIKLDAVDGVVQAGASALIKAANASVIAVSGGLDRAAQAVNAVVNSTSRDANLASATTPDVTTAKPTLGFVFNPDVDLWYRR